MLNKIGAFLSRKERHGNKDIDKQLRLTSAALLIEVARADYDWVKEEEHALVDQLVSILDLSREEVNGLIVVAENTVEESTSLYDFTSVINENLTKQQKFSLLHGMWKVALADGNLDRYEEHLIRKVADLLHLPHADYIKAKFMAIRQ